MSLSHQEAAQLSERGKPSRIPWVARALPRAFSLALLLASSNHRYRWPGKKKRRHLGESPLNAETRDSPPCSNPVEVR